MMEMGPGEHRSTCHAAMFKCSVHVNLTRPCYFPGLFLGVSPSSGVSLFCLSTCLPQVCTALSSWQTLTLSSKLPPEPVVPAAFPPAWLPHAGLCLAPLSLAPEGGDQKPSCEPAHSCLAGPLPQPGFLLPREVLAFLGKGQSGQDSNRGGEPEALGELAHPWRSPLWGVPGLLPLRPLSA